MAACAQNIAAARRMSAEAGGGPSFAMIARTMVAATLSAVGKGWMTRAARTALPRRSGQGWRSVAPACIGLIVHQLPPLRGAATLPAMSLQRTLITKPDGRRPWYYSRDRPPPKVEASASGPALESEGLALRGHPLLGGGVVCGPG